MTDDEFLAAFESCTLPYEQWNHHAHVRVAFLYAARHDAPSAADHMRSGIRAYNKAKQVPEAVDRGYHETTTSAFMQLVSEAVAAAEPCTTFEEFSQRWPQLFDKRVLLKFYSRSRIMSPEAKVTFVEPDKMALSLSVLDTYSDEVGPKKTH